MKNVLMVFIFCLSALANAQTTQSPEQIRQQMAKIRQTTNWDDPVAAKKANEEIKKLAKQLMMGGTQQGGQGQGQGAGSGTGNQQGSTTSNDAEELAEINEEMVNQKMDIFSQIWEAAAGGEGADILLAEPLREEIGDEFREDDDKTVKSQDYLDKMTYLVLDMSMPGIDLIIDAMSQFRGIKTLVITTKETVLRVDLQKILENADEYPLEELYIINLGPAVTTLPAVLGNFTGLKTLGLFNNGIKGLPSSISKLTQLRTLYADVNPLSSVIMVISPLTNLTELGIAKTDIPNSEVIELRQLLPGCNIMTE